MEPACVVAAVIENAAPKSQGEPGSRNVLEGDVLLLTDNDKDDALLQPTSDNPTEKNQSEEKTAAKTKSDEVIEHVTEPLLRSCHSTASMKVKNMKKLTFPRGHFPRLEECAHFHYENVDFGNIQLALADGQSEGPTCNLDTKEPVFLVQITCQGRNWLVKRCYEDFRVLDKHLHLCIYDRRFSQLCELPRFDTLKDTLESVTKMLANYLSCFSAIADNKISCGPVLTWMEIDNKGNRMLVSEEASINVPAIAAAHVTKRYTAQDNDELTFEVGDIVSVIDMPPKEDTGWWRGKHGFQVGFFPCDCVELINDKIPPSVQSSVPKPVCKKHGKLVTFLRSFMKSRPPPQKLRQRGILRERVFGCDLGEHLHNSAHEVPQVVKSCAEFIEKNGVVDGIYRLSGISSNIQKLRHEFDSEQIPDLSRDVYRQDIHSVGSLCKLYFRELPNPLLTYQLYDRFSEAVSAATDEDRLATIHNVIQQLPPPHYRTLEFLMRHLSHLATFSPVTNMHTKNLAIVWAPNLLRSRQIESACFSGTAAFMEVRIQSVVVEFILNNTEALFSPKLNATIKESTGKSTASRPKSLLISSPSTKLLSLEEAQARTQAQLSSPATTSCLSHSDYIEVGDGPEALVGKFHTVIDLPMDSKRPPTKAKKSPVGNWISSFLLGKSHSLSKRKLKRHPSEPNEIKSIALPGGRGDSGTLRSTKSEESLTSLRNVEGEPSNYHPLRPCFTSEAISAVASDDLRFPRNKEHAHAVPQDESPYGPGSGCSDDVKSPPHQEDDFDLCSPVAGISTLDFDPMSFQFIPAGLKQDRDGNKMSKSACFSSESEPVSSPNNNISCSPSPDFSPVLWKGVKNVTSKSPSPKLRKKSLKSKEEVQTPSPLTSSSPPEETPNAKAVCIPYKHCSPLSTVSQTSGLTELSHSAQNIPDPGTDRLMSSVCVLPPQPSSMSAARKLALALAETAHKASCGSQRRAHLPSQPSQRQQSAHVHKKPLRPSVLDLKVYPEDYGSPCVSQRQKSSQSPTEHLFCPHTVHFSPGHLCLEQLTDEQESACNFTPNVSPLGSGSLCEDSVERRNQREEHYGDDTQPTFQSIGVSTPTQPVCFIPSPLTSPVYVNADSTEEVLNFRAVLAETSMPASVDNIFPRSKPPSAPGYSPDRPLGMVDSTYSVYSHPHWHDHRPVEAAQISALHCPQPDAVPACFSGPKMEYRKSSEGHLGGLVMKQSMSPQYRRYHKHELHHCDCNRPQDEWNRSKDVRVGHPGIRRARSFHSPDILCHIDQRVNKKAPYQRLIHTGIHPVRLQLEERAASPHQSVLSYINPIDGAHYYAEPSPQRGKPRSRSVRHSPSYDSPHHLPTVDRDFCQENRDITVYKAQDADLLSQPTKHISKSRQRSKGLAVSPSEVPTSSSDATGVMHTRSKSDPGNVCLLFTHRGESQNAVVSTSPTSPRSLQADAEDTRQLSGRQSSVDFGPLQQIQIKNSSHRTTKLDRNLSVTEDDGPKLKPIKYRGGSHTQGPDQCEPVVTKAVYSHSGVVKPSILRRSTRSQSTRERHYHHYHPKSPLDPEHPGSLASQHHRRTQSTRVRPTHSDHMKEYYVRSGKSGGEYSPGQGIKSPHGHKLLSKVLGQDGICSAAPRSGAGLYEGF